MHDQMIPEALSKHYAKIEKDSLWSYAVKKYQEEPDWLSCVYIFTNYAPVDASIGHSFSRIFYRSNPSEAKKLNARIRHIIWHSILLPVPEVGHGHRHFLVFGLNDFSTEALNLLPRLQNWNQLSNIDVDWCME